MLVELDLDDVQGDVLIGLQKNVENFVFFKILDPVPFKAVAKAQVVKQVTSADLVRQRELILHRKYFGVSTYDRFAGLNLGISRSGLTQLIGNQKELLDPAFEQGADHPDTIRRLNDPPASRWLLQFVSDRIDGLLLITGPDRASVLSRSKQLLTLLGRSIKVVHSEIGVARPGKERGHEHFGFLDGISQPGIRGLTSPSDPWHRPDQGLPGQDAIWPGEFVFGYPGQHPKHPTRRGPEPEMAAPWMRNGSYMVFRRLEQKVPEFRRYVREQAARLGMDPELLAARMVGRWKSGAPMELTPRRDDLALARDESRNNDFEYSDDPHQRRCPYATHIRKVYPRDDAPGGDAEAQRHRIIRRGIPFGPEVGPGETTTRHSRGLMFVCYQTSIERQFEYIQRQANNPGFVDGKFRPGTNVPVTPGYDPIIGQAPGNSAREMDEPYPNYPAGNRRTTLAVPHEFVVLTAAGYFFMPSISALRTVLT